MSLTDINDIRNILERHGFRFSKALGQNFLTQAWVPERIAENAVEQQGTGALEIGPGIGCLTEQLSMRAERVVSIEMDRRLQPVLRETLAGRDNVEIIFGDALKQELKQIVGEKFSGLTPVVAANLPYNVTSPLITAFIEAGCFETITVMIQREVARRICAPANTEDYGSFGIFVQWYYEPELLFDVSPACFVPQPKVTSTVIRLRKRSEPICPVMDVDYMMKLVRAAFNQRRKTLVNSLSTGTGIAKPAIEQAMNELGLDTRLRGEALDIVEFARLSDKILTISS